MYDKKNSTSWEFGRSIAANKWKWKNTDDKIMCVADIDWNTLFKFVSFFFSLHFYRIDLQRRALERERKKNTISIDMSRSSAIKIESCWQATAECVFEKCFRSDVASDSASELRTFHPDILCRKRQYEFQDGICCNAFVHSVSNTFPLSMNHRPRNPWSQTKDVMDHELVLFDHSQFVLLFHTLLPSLFADTQAS